MSAFKSLFEESKEKDFNIHTPDPDSSIVRAATASLKTGRSRKPVTIPVNDLQEHVDNRNKAKIKELEYQSAAYMDFVHGEYRKGISNDHNDIPNRPGVVPGPNDLPEWPHDDDLPSIDHLN